MPLDGEDRIRLNTRGQDFVLGVYPLLFDDICRFLAIDFDGENSALDALAFLAGLHGRGGAVRRTGSDRHSLGRLMRRARHGDFWAPETVPERYRGRLFHVHNPNVTLVRTTAVELEMIAAWIAEKLNRSPGPVRMLLPEGGVSMLDAPGGKFHDTAANEALFSALERHFVTSETHRLIRARYHIDDAAFAELVERHVREVMSARIR